MKQGTTIETVHAGAAARQALGRMSVETRGQGFTDITDAVARWVAESGIAAASSPDSAATRRPRSRSRRTPIPTCGATF